MPDASTLLLFVGASLARRRRLNRVSGTIYLGLGVTAALTGPPAKA